MSLASPTVGDRQRTQLLKPLRASLSPISPPPLFADQTSNLSSDLETMDSGFAQSAGGSNTNINNRQAAAESAYWTRQKSRNPYDEAPQSSRSAPSSPMQFQQSAGGRNLRRIAPTSGSPLGEAGDSLTFVDDDEDVVERAQGLSKREGK